MPSNGSAVITGIAILENPRSPDPKKFKTLVFDARFYAEGEEEDTIFASLQYFNSPRTPLKPDLGCDVLAILYNVRSTLYIFKLPLSNYSIVEHEFIDPTLSV